MNPKRNVLVSAETSYFYSFDIITYNIMLSQNDNNYTHFSKTIDVTRFVRNGSVNRVRNMGANIHRNIKKNNFMY